VRFPWQRRIAGVENIPVELSWAGRLPIVRTSKPLTLGQSIAVKLWLDAVRKAPPEHFEGSSRPGGSS